MSIKTQQQTTFPCFQQQKINKLFWVPRCQQLVDAEDHGNVVGVHSHLSCELQSSGIAPRVLLFEGDLMDDKDQVLKNIYISRYNLYIYHKMVVWTTPNRWFIPGGTGNCLEITTIAR